MPTILWHIELSHYNEKARWALDYKGIPHERRTPLPGMHGAVALALTRGGQRRLPIVELDGRRVGDSTAIIAALEAYRPEPALYPDEPDDLARALALEDEFDVGLGPEVRRFGWHQMIDDSDATVDALMTTPSAGKRRLMRVLIPLARPAVKLDYTVTADSAENAARVIRGFVDRIEAELQPSGYLVGDRFSVADLTAAALLTPLLAPPGRPYMPATTPQATLDLRAELEARPGGAWVTEMYTRHRGVSAEVAA